MAVTVLERRRGSRVVDVQYGAAPKRSLTETWLVKSDTGTDDELDVYYAQGLPQLGDLWLGFNGNSDPALRCVNKRVQDHDQTKKLWHVECRFSSILPDEGHNPSVEGLDPPDWEPRIEWSTELEQREVQTYVRADIQDPNKLIVNSAGDPLMDPIIDYYPTPVLRFTRYYPSFTSAVIHNYVNKLNSDSFLGYAPGTAKMAEITSRAEFLYGFQYWEVTFVFRFRDTWTAYRIDRGQHFIDPVDGERKGAGETTGKFVNLDGTGAKLGKGLDPLIVSWDYLEQVPFNPLVFQ